MRLLYCYTEFLDKNGNPQQFRGLDTIEVNFSATDKFSYDKNTNTLRRSDRVKPLPDNFWSNGSGGTNIYNVNVISGANGSGKTTVIYYIIDLLNYIYHDFGSTLDDNDRRTRFDPSGDRCILVFEDGGELLLLDTAKGCEPVKTEGFDTPPSEGVLDRLRRTKLINMTNTLNQRDYELHIGARNHRLRDYFVYDCTLGSTIGPDVSTFFLYEVYKQIQFVFDSRGLSNYKVSDLRIPTSLRIILRTNSFGDYFDAAGGEKDRSLATRLSMLCVASYLDNVAYAKNIAQYNLKKEWFWNDVTKQQSLFEQIELVKIYSGILVISGSGDKALQVWDMFKGTHRTPIMGNTGTVNCVVGISDRLCVCGSSDNKLRVWDFRSYVCLHTMEGHTRSVNCVAVTADGLCVSGSDDATLRVWDIRTGKYLRTLKGHTQSVNCVAVTADGLCVSGSSDNTLRVWDLSTGKCLRTMEGHALSVTCNAVTKDGRCVSGSRDRTLRVWDIRTGDCLRTMEGHNGWVYCVAVTEDGKCISGSADTTLREWDLHTGECLRTMEGHTDKVRCISVAAERLCFSGSDDKTLRVWDMRDGGCLRTMEGSARPIKCISTICDTIGDSLINEIGNFCNSYLQYIDNSKDSLFSSFRHVGRDIYELSIDKDKNGKVDSELNNQLGEFLQKYMATCKPYYTLDFDWGLSSGEENMLRIFTWLHHIFPQDTTGEYVIRNNENGSDEGGTTCDSVIIFMDEADLTLHPEWQRRLIYNLTSSIPQIYPAAVAKDIQLVLTTHSPLLLGDIPRENVLYLRGKGDGQSESCATEPSETFGQNIHTILKDSFFLTNGVGEFAKDKINNTAQRLRDKISGQKDVSAQELAECKAIIDLVSPGVIKSKLLELYDEATGGSDRSVRIVQGYIDTMSTEQLEAVADAFRAEIERRKK